MIGRAGGEENPSAALFAGHCAGHQPFAHPSVGRDLSPGKANFQGWAVRLGDHAHRLGFRPKNAFDKFFKDAEV